MGGEKGRGAKVLQTYRHTDRHTYRPSDEAGPRGAFAPKNTVVYRSKHIKKDALINQSCLNTVERC